MSIIRQGRSGIPTLKISENHRYLVHDDGRPFFYLGDTAWAMLLRLNREEVNLYLENRARKGFSVIQTVILCSDAVAGNAQADSLNAYGHAPLHDCDPDRPNEAYFAHIDYVVASAAEWGLFLGLLPAWGHIWRACADGTRGLFTPESARRYGLFLGKRYAGKPVIWILGGDRNITTPEERQIITALALGLREGGRGRHLLTFHPRGPGQSSDWLHEAEWLDFNMIQSSHPVCDHDNGLFTEHDYALTPVKPVVDGEPRYEMIQAGFYYKGVAKLQRFDDYDARQAAYWSLLAGACGHTYGHHSIWQMWQPGREPIIGACVPWQEALDHLGAFQMGLLRRLFESRAWQTLVPARDMVLDGPAGPGAKVRAARAADGSFAFVYSPRGEPFTVSMNVIHPQRVKAYWFDPRYGSTDLFYDCDSPGIQTFAPPTSGRGRDWLLILEDPARAAKRGA